MACWNESLTIWQYRAISILPDDDIPSSRDFHLRVHLPAPMYVAGHCVVTADSNRLYRETPGHRRESLEIRREVRYACLGVGNGELGVDLDSEGRSSPRNMVMRRGWIRAPRKGAFPDLRGA